jgi:protein SCO1/2
MVRARCLALVLASALGGCGPSWTPTAASHDSHARVTAHDSLFDHPWIWLDDRGERVELAQWRGTPFVLAAIFTTCQETCPRTVAKLREIYDQFAREHRAAEFVVVTIDPETDTPARLRAFRKERNLPDAWHLLTGGTQETQQLADLLGVHIMTMDTGVDVAHMVHDSKIVMFDGDGVSTSEFDIM